MKDFCLNFMKMANKSCLVQQMTEKITGEVDAKICFGKNCKKYEETGKDCFVKCIFTP